MNDVIRNIIYMARRFPLATVLNFTGLVVAFAACYLFMTQVLYNHSYNKGLTNYEQLYRVELNNFMGDGEWITLVNRDLAETMERMPQVDGMALMGQPQPWTAQKDGTEFKFTGILVSNNALVTLAPNVVDGHIGWSDDDQGGIIIPASIAVRYFGTKYAAGKHMLWYTGDSIDVRGVFEDFPANSIMQNAIYANMHDENKGNQHNFNYICFLRLNSNTDIDEACRSISEGAKEKMHQWYVENGIGDRWEEMKDKKMQINLRPVADTWFAGVDPGKDRGNKAVDMILQLACLLVLVIAAINSLNFMLAESPMRIKGINTRRCLGERVSKLRMNLVTEAIAVSLVAFIIAVGICWLITQWPFMQELTVGSIALTDHPVLIASIGMAAVCVGIVAGTYPAYYVISFQPAMVLKGSFGLTPRGRQLRTALLVMQFIITCIMVIYIGILYLQSNYIYNSDYGYAKDELLFVDAAELDGKQEALRTEVLKLTGVKDAAYSQFVLGSSDQYMEWGRGDDEHHVMFIALPVDCHYMRTMGIDIIEGRDFNEHDRGTYIINEAARREWNWVEMDKNLLDVGEETKVVGVCRNVRATSTRCDNSSSPLVFLIYDEEYVNRGWANNMTILNIRVAAGSDMNAIRQKVKKVFMQMGAEREPEVRVFDNMLDDNYTEEFRFIRQVVIFSIVCLIITLIGVSCLTMFETEYRRKEIGIRKVMGSSTGEILTMFCRHYALLLMISFVVAAPVAWYIGRNWLQSFAERTPIYWWIFPLSLLVVAIVTMTVVIVQSWRTANENPVKSIKSE